MKFSINFLAKLLIVATLFTLATGCATPNSKANRSQYDFDHGVFFEKEELGDNRFHILVRSDEKVPFNRLATFLIRKALQTCKSYGFKLEVLGGVEEYDDRLAHPNLIIPSLSANLECPAKQ